MKPQFEIKKNIASKQDLPHYFLNELLQPKRYMNADAIDIHFKAEHIHHLCNIC
jgi:hypothetical protein